MLGGMFCVVVVDPAGVFGGGVAAEIVMVRPSFPNVAITGIVD